MSALGQPSLGPIAQDPVEEDPLVDEEKNLMTIFVFHPSTAWPCSSTPVWLYLGEVDGVPLSNGVQAIRYYREAEIFSYTGPDGTNYTIARAVFTDADFYMGAGALSSPVPIKELGITDSGPVVSLMDDRTEFWVPTSGEIIADDMPGGNYYHPDKLFFKNTKAIVFLIYNADL